MSPQAPPLHLIRIALVLVGLTAISNTPADADLWGHLLFGRDIVATRSVRHADRYSFTTDREWVNHEWLSEIAIYGAYALGGVPGLVALKMSVILATLAIVFLVIRRYRPAPPARDGLLLLALAGIFARTLTVRPQLFSVLLFAALLALLLEIERGRRRFLALVPLLMVLWVNFHGGWLVGLGAFGLWVAGRLVDRDAGARDRALAGGAGVAAVVATLVNPYGPGMWGFLFETVRLGRADIEEWSSVLAFPYGVGIPWAVMLAAAALAVIRGRRPSLAHAAIVSSLAAATLKVSRLDAFFALSVVILLGPRLADLGANRPAPAGAGVDRRLWIVTLAAGLIMAAGAGTLVARNLQCLSMKGPWLPEPEAAEFVTANRLRGRMLTWFDWGEYAIWHFTPDLRVSFDGRRETVYSAATIRAHRRFYADAAGSREFVARLEPDYIWLPNHLPVAGSLPGYGWQPIFRGPVSSIFAPARGVPSDFVEPPARADEPRCFPGP